MLSLASIIDDTIEKTKQLLEGYSIENLHKALLYSATYVAMKNRGIDVRLVQPLEEKIPRPLVYQARRILTPKFAKMLNILENKLKSKELVVLSDANIKKLIKKTKITFDNIEYVMVYDCISLIEFIIIAATVRLNNLESIIPDMVFVNPIGLTRYVTHQLTSLDYRPVLREFAHLLARELGAYDYYKSAYIDLKVHEYGSFGIEEYVSRIDIRRIVEEVLDNASNKTVLVTTDHGYDIVYDTNNDYLYVTHGFRESLRENHYPLLLFSRFSFLLKASPGR